MKIERQAPSVGGFAASETRNRSSVAAGAGATAASTAATAATAASTTPEATAVRLSGVAAQISAAADASPVNSAKVAEIRKAIAEGRFTINAEAIAGRLIDSARELVAAGRRG